jgi:hypothetical protein
VTSHQDVKALFNAAPNGPSNQDPEIRGLRGRRQVLTSRNLRGGVLVDVALGGLHYQIEHHLFRICLGRTCAAPNQSSGGSASSTT